MLEKFTENAIKIINYSREEARRFEFSQVQIEHLFLGILHDKTNSGTITLNSLDINLKKARRVTQRVIGRGFSDTPLEDITFDNKVLSFFSKVEELSLKFGSNTITAEHILLKIINFDDNNLQNIFNELNLIPEELIEKIKHFTKEKGITPDGDEGLVEELPNKFAEKSLNKITKGIIDYSKKTIMSLNHTFISTDNILLSLVNIDSIAKKLLKSHRLDNDSVKSEILRMINYGSGYEEKLVSFTPSVEQALELSWSIARKYNHTKIGSLHLLNALMSMDNCSSSQLLKHLDIDPEQIKFETFQIMKKYSYDHEPNPSYEDLLDYLDEAAVSDINVKSSLDFFDENENIEIITENKIE